jgi:hypothetical protein
MRIEAQCPCGAPVLDKSDNLPHKAYYIPDQAWEGVIEKLEKAIEAVAMGNHGTEEGKDLVHQALCEGSRHMYQCRRCGRIFVADSKGQLHAYTASAQDTEREILRA